MPRSGTGEEAAGVKCPAPSSSLIDVDDVKGTATAVVVPSFLLQQIYIAYSERCCSKHTQKIRSRKRTPAAFSSFSDDQLVGSTTTYAVVVLYVFPFFSLFPRPQQQSSTGPPGVFYILCTVFSLSFFLLEGRARPLTAVMVECQVVPVTLLLLEGTAAASSSPTTTTTTLFSAY
jgi:hypothetical protein